MTDIREERQRTDAHLTSETHKTVVMKQKRIKTNARERRRMHGVNTALKKLKNCLPLCEADSNRDHFHQTTDKLCKIETLKLAKNYISALGELLEKNGSLTSEEYEKILTSDLRDTTKAMLKNNCARNSDILL